jgi:hypothetical protein
MTKTFDHARARETAKRIREGKPGVPVFISIAERVEDAIVISSIGRKAA